jgi:hypothetical protein
MAAELWPPFEVTLEDGRLLKRMQTYPVSARTVRGEPTVMHVYQAKGGLRVIASQDTTQHGLLRHVSLSYAKHNPSWKDIKLVRRAFFRSDQDAMMVLPTADFYVNVHEHCFHIWETPVKWGVM